MSLYNINTSNRTWWEAGSEIKKYVNKKITDNPEMDWIEYTLKKYYINKLPIESCLSLGCGRGQLERILAQKRAFNHCDGYEDEGELEVYEAIKEAKANSFNNIDYHIVKMNSLRLPNNYYDSIWTNGVLNHLTNLEHVFSQTRKALKSDGLFIINEYVGPNCYQFSNHQKEIINLCLLLIPYKYRIINSEIEPSTNKRDHTSTRKIRWYTKRLVDKILDGDLIGVFRRRWNSCKAYVLHKDLIKTNINFPSVRDVMAFEPTLAIRSGDIYNLIEQNFHILEKKDYGGSIFQFLLNGIIGNFKENDQTSEIIMQMLVMIEDTLINLHEIQSNFSYIVASPKMQP